MTLTKLAVFLFVSFLATQVQSYGYVSERLMDYVTENSNPAIIPLTSLDKPITVKLALSLIDIKEVNYERNEVELYGWLALSWNNELTFSPDMFNNISVFRIPISKLWVPDITDTTGQIEILDYMGSNLASLNSKGDVYWVPQVKLRVMCDLVKSQIANQTSCTFKVGSWTYDNGQISLHEHSTFELDDYFTDSQYKVLNTVVEKRVKKYHCCPEGYDQLFFTFSFQKTPASN